MNTFHSRQTDCDRHARKNENTDTLNFTSQIAPSIRTVRHTKRVKTNATIFKSRCSRTVLCYRFDRVEALPLVSTRFLRLANSSPKTARSPARQSRDSRATSGKTSGKTSGAISAQRPGNGRTVATAMPLDGRADDSQDNLRVPDANGHVRAGNLRDDSPQISTMTFKNYEHTNHTNARS
jgi:hypothetical protein